jgi:hypothetical protein
MIRRTGALVLASSFVAWGAAGQGPPAADPEELGPC